VQIVCETLSQKHSTQKRAGGVSQGVGPEFKPQYCQKKKNNNNNKKKKKKKKKTRAGDVVYW
jgi:hypothetical protein